MKERPILFSRPMVQAILAGQKTQARWVVKPTVSGCTVGAYTRHHPCGLRTFEPVNVQEDGDPWTDIHCPFGVPGDKLWVREIYKADSYKLYPGEKWTPSIHVPKSCARLWLRVTGIEVERLQAISGEDAIAEGICHWSEYGDEADISDFAELWDSINKKNGHGWKTNPWVWVLKFGILEGPA